MKDTLKELFQNKVFLAFLDVLICLVILRLINLLFQGMEKKKGRVGVKFSFMKGVLEAVTIIYTVLRIATLSDMMSRFANTILMSSSLLVVVLGFVFQEGLSNIIHGFIITIFKPFDIGDRVEIDLSGGQISGYVKDITLRHTVIVSILDNAESIIPNSLLDTSVIRNLTTQDQSNRYPLIVSIPYADAQNEKKLQKAKELISGAILENPLTVDTRKEKDQPLFVKVDLGDSAVTLTCFIDTKTAEDNFTACSQIKEVLLQRFAEAGIDFAYQHLEISGVIHTDRSSEREAH